MEEGNGRTGKKTLALAGASVLVSLTLGHLLRSSPVIHQATGPMPPPVQAILRTNKPTYSLINYHPSNTFFLPPALPSNAPNGFVMQWSADLERWTNLTEQDLVISNNGFTWVTYKSNFADHSVVAIATNTMPGIQWGIKITNDHLFFRYKAL